MSTSTLGLFLRHLALSEEVSRLGTVGDHTLLASYESGRGQAAFTELMRRYGPMVLRTCCRVLGHGPDAEDAFQATFVLLARKAGSISKREALGGWLHRVAYHSAVDVLIQSARRKAHERQAGAMTYAEPDPITKATWNEIRPILDAELDALPDEARRLLIACYLQEKTYSEVAAELGIPRSSVARHVERARGLLARRLARRGITVSSVLLAVLLEDSAKGAGVPAVLLVHTLEAARTFSEQATGIVSDSVVRLVKGGLAKMAKGWTHWSMALAGWVSLLGAGLIACQTLKAWPERTPESEPRGASSAEPPAQEVEKRARIDCFGDPLPPGALARMGTVRLVNNGHGIVPPPLHLAFSPDGKLLASHIDRMTVALWDAATGKEIRCLTADALKGHIASLGFSPDGKTLVALTWDLKICVWDAATGKVLRTGGYQDPVRDAHVQPDRGMAFLPDGRMLAATDFLKPGEASQKIRGIRVWDVATGKEVRQLSDPAKKREDLLSASAFSRDGKLLATTVTLKRDISVWDVASGQEIRQLTRDEGAANEGSIRTLAFSDDGKMLAAATSRTVSVWDAATGKPLRQMKATGHAFGAVLAFSPDGKTLVGGQEGHLWEVNTGKQIRSLGVKFTQVALFSPDGKVLALGDASGVIRLWDLSTGKEIVPHRGHRQRIRTVFYSPDGKTLASMGEDETVRLWDAATGKELRQVAQHNGRAKSRMALAYSPDGKLLASLELDMLHLWDLGTGKEIRQLKGKGTFQSVTFSPDGTKLAAGMNGSNGQTVVLLEVATGKTIYARETEMNSTEVVFSPDGRMLATPGKDNTVILYEADTGELITHLGGLKLSGQREDPVSVRFLAFSPDGRVLATSSSGDEKVRLWEVASGKEIVQLDGLKHCGDGKQTWWDSCVLAFSPDGCMLATAVPERHFWKDADLAVTLWEVPTGKEITRLAGHRNFIRTLAFAPDGKTLASGGDDLTCLVWDVAAAARRPKLAATGPLPPKSLSKEQLKAAWADLASTEAAKAYQAIWALRAAPGQAVPLLKGRVRSAGPIADPEQLARWIADLDNESFPVREKSQRALKHLGEPVIPALRQALADQPPLEVKRRLQNILAAVEPKLVTNSPERLRQIRIVQVLESIATPEAQQELQTLANGVVEVSLAREARAALARLARRSASTP
ncbi:MAG TPA: sigma-70 family RNA polymerase sigma factor [Gemmataceae bacterium]|jgi:RNA polymerase sigma factor (sigma-70 family)